MSRQIIATDKAPGALGPYSQAVKAGALVFTAGQVGIDPASGKLVEGVEGQTRQVMANLAAVLEAAGTGWDRVVKTTIFITDMEHFSLVNRVYQERLSGDYPARSTVAVRQLPLGALVEIEAVAEV